MYLVRKKKVSPSQKPHRAIEVCEKVPQPRHVVVEAPKPRDKHVHCHHHHRTVDHENPRRDGIHIDITEFGDPKQPGISIAVGLGERCPPKPRRSPSPIIEVREPRHVQAKPHLDLEKVRLEKIRPVEGRVKDTTVPARLEIHRQKDHKAQVEIKMPSRKHMPEAEACTWDSELQAWVVRRSPRAHFG